jgi:hypothetical protein
MLTSNRETLRTERKSNTEAARVSTAITLIILPLLASIILLPLGEAGGL